MVLPPCRQLKPVFHALGEEYKGKVDFVTVNVDSMPELAEKYKISSIPTLVFLSSEGERFTALWVFAQLTKSSQTYQAISKLIAVEFYGRPIERQIKQNAAEILLNFRRILFIRS